MSPPKPELAVNFDVVMEKNLEQLKMLNAAIFPIKYQDQFYKDCMACGDVTQFAFHNDVAIGGIACRMEKQPGGKGARLYIMTLGVLAPYRGYGVGTKLLGRSLTAAARDPSIQEAYLHVQTSNEEAIRFYTRLGFSIRETVANYYKKLNPPDAVVLALGLREALPPALQAAAAAAPSAKA